MQLTWCKYLETYSPASMSSLSGAQCSLTPLYLPQMGL